MQLRRFVARTTPNALDAVRSAFGADAIILANRKIGTDVEIIATGSIDDGALDSAVLEASDREAISSLDTEEVVATAPIDARANNAGSVAGVTKSDTPAVSVNTQSTDNIASDNEDTRVKAAESAKFDETESKPFPEQLPQTALAEVTAFAGSELEQQFDDMFTRLEKRFRGIEVNLWGNNHPHRRELLGQLLKMGIGAELAIRLAERVAPELSLDESIRQTMSLLADSIPVSSNEVMMTPGITVLTGLSGSGKSTVMMKLASEYVSRHGTQSIVLICADTSKIGAFETIQVFGKLLGVPVVQAHTPDELDNLILAFKHKSMILVEHAPSATLKSIGQEASEEIAPDVESGETSYSSSVGGTPDSLAVSDSHETSGDSNCETPLVRRVAVLSAASQSASIEALLSRKDELGLSYCMLSHLDAQAKLGDLIGPLVRHQVRVVSWSDTALLQKPMQKADASVLVATAIAMSKRLEKTADDAWLLQLLQPSGITDRYTPMPQFVSPVEERGS